MKPPADTTNIDQLLQIMASLRDPDTGCPWDIKQDFRSISAYTVEEAFEVADAIEREDMSDLKEELGDLLLQVVFHARMAEEAGSFQFSDVVAAICEKMVTRHPHVFEEPVSMPEQELRNAWEAQKAQERKRKKQNGDGNGSALDGVARTLPALIKTQKLIERARRAGFLWSQPRDAFDRCSEELREVTEAWESGVDQAAVEEELGDLFLACVSLASELKINGERALADAARKFENRFRAMEAQIESEGGSLAEAPPDELQRRWDRAKLQTG